MGVLKREGGKNSEAGLEADCKAGRILIEVGREDSVVEVLRNEFLLLLEGFVGGDLLLIRRLLSHFHQRVILMLLKK